MKYLQDSIGSSHKPLCYPDNSKTWAVADHRTDIQETADIRLMIDAGVITVGDR